MTITLPLSIKAYAKSVLQVGISLMALSLNNKYRSVGFQEHNADPWSGRPQGKKCRAGPAPHPRTPDCVLSIPTHFRTRKEETRQQKEARPGIAA